MKPHLQKITRSKWTGGTAQVIECLLCKHDILTSKLQFYQKKINKQTKPNIIGLRVRLK
jgi:hypothetical protein